MAANLTFTLAQLAPWLDQVAEDAKRVDWTAAFKQIALLLEEATKENFENSHDPWGTPWKPLAKPRSRPRDKRAKTGGGNEQRPLRDTGLLMASLSAMGQHHIENISASVLNWGTNLEYAGVHQWGHTFQRPEKVRGPGEKPWVFEKDGRTIFTRKIKAHTQVVPARPFLGMNQQLLADINEVLWDEFSRQVLGTP